jgi:creatinine amidohydrolase
MRFAEMTAPEIESIDRDSTVVTAPIAACEQHSDHLAVSTDVILCGAVADGVERHEPRRVLRLPLIALGASGHHLPFGGTLSASLPTYEAMLIDLIEPLLVRGFRRILFLNGHGGNVDPMRVALRRLDEKYPRAILTGASYWELAERELAALCEGPRKTVGHACEIETSMMLHLRPDLVRTDRIQNDPSATPSGLEGLFWARDFKRRTDHGAIGYPQFATAEKGRLMLDAIVDRVAGVVRELSKLPIPALHPMD